MPTCHKCNSTINQEELLKLNKKLIKAVDSGVKEDLTDLEDAMYQGMYCAACCKAFRKPVKPSKVVAPAVLLTCFLSVQDYFMKAAHIVTCHAGLFA